VLIAGGENLQGFLASTEIYDVSTDSFEQSTPLMDIARAANDILLPNGKVLVPGGIYAPGHNELGSVSTTELYDPVSNSFATGPSMNVSRVAPSIPLLNGKMLIVGGDLISSPNNGTTVLRSTELYTP
jgi:hypothetical protein